ncbi:unnamed protein product [Phytophthora fragariaefolia]|uniref:Unnamed protein product n=1 Tax=Phytophthora fragariaefolia TaxID=1490495 RepID=A0A9W6YPH6_9STRA|nr:unnamed protein product [Phytophthora fragariaefolia]
MALATWCWGPHLHQDFNYPLVVCWSDKVSAVSWTHRLHSNNAFTQEINRAVGLAEAVFRFRLSDRHLPGAINRMADAGSFRGARFKCPRIGGDSTRTSPRIAVQITGQVVPQEIPVILEAVVVVVCRHGVPCVASERPDCRITTACSLRGVLLSTRKWVIRLQRQLPTDHSPKTCAIAWYHRWELGFNIRLPTHHAMAIKGIQRLQPSPQPKQPITFPMLRVLHQQLDLAHDHVLWGATVMGFFLLLKHSEYLRAGAHQYQFAIRRSDVCFYDRQGRRCELMQTVRGVQINFRGGKNDEAGVDVSWSLATSTISWCCPVRAVWYLVNHHHSVSHNPDELLCKVQSDKYLQVRDVNQRIKDATSITGQGL